MKYLYKGDYLNKADFIFTRTITDDNSFLQECIQLDEEIKDALFNKSSIDEGMNFVNFLQTYYTNNDIKRIFKTMEDIGEGLTGSGMGFFRAIEVKFLFINFQKVESHFIDLFREFVRLRTIEEKLQVDRKTTRYSVNNIDYIPI